LYRARTTLEAAQAALAEAEEGLAAAEAAQEAAEAEAAAEAENSTESESSSDDGFARNLQLKEIPEAGDYSYEGLEVRRRTRSGVYRSSSQTHTHVRECAQITQGTLLTHDHAPPHVLAFAPLRHHHYHYTS
jgi:hypothetical protein